MAKEKKSMREILFIMALAHLLVGMFIFRITCYQKWGQSFPGQAHAWGDVPAG